MSSEGTIHIVDDDNDVRQSLVRLLQSAGYHAVPYSSAADFLAAVEQIGDGCVILDVRMPEMDGLELQARLVAMGVQLPSIVMTGLGDVQTAVSAMKGGAIDFIEKPFSDEALLTAVEAALNPARGVDQEIAHASRMIGTLSPRERQVLDALVAGHQNKMIAYTLGISVRTVEVHRARMMERLGVRQFAEAVRVAVLAQLAPEDTRKTPPK